MAATRPAIATWARIEVDSMLNPVQERYAELVAMMLMRSQTHNKQQEST